MEEYVNDFDKCLVNPFREPQHKRVSAYRKLNEKYPGIFNVEITGSNGNPVSMNMALPFMTCMYDMSSPFAQYIGNEKLAISCKMSGISFLLNKKNNTLPLEYVEMIDGRIESFNIMVVHYVKENNSLSWQTLLMYDKLFYMKSMEVFSTTETGKLKEEAAGIDQLRKNIETLISQVLMEKEKVSVDKTFLKLLNDDVGIGLFNEQIAKRKKEGLPATDINPYKLKNPK